MCKLFQSIALVTDEYIVKIASGGDVREEATTAFWDELDILVRANITQYLPCARQYSKDFTWVNSFYPHENCKRKKQLLSFHFAHEEAEASAVE